MSTSEPFNVLWIFIQISNNYVNYWIQTQGNKISPRAAVAGSAHKLFSMNSNGAAPSGSPVSHFITKQVIDRVLAALPSPHSPSHYYQLALFSLVPAIGERCGLISALLDFHNKRGVKEREQSGMEQQGMIDVASNHTAAAMFSSIPPSPREIRLKTRLFMIRHQIKSGSITHIFHCPNMMFFSIQFSKWFKLQQPEACLLLFRARAQSKTLF